MRIGRYLFIGLVTFSLSAAFALEKEQGESLSIDNILESNLKNWAFYDPITQDDYSKSIYVKLQTERLHGSEKGLLFTFNNTINPTKNGETDQDIWRIVPFSGINDFKDDIEKYTRLSCWAYVEGQRNPLISLLMYFKDPKTGNLRSEYQLIAVEPNKWTKLIVRYDFVPLEIRKNISKIAIAQFYMRPEIGDGKCTKVYIDDFRLEREQERQHYGTDADPSIVIVNKIGYMPGDMKNLVVNQNNPALAFTVYESESNKEVFSKSLDFSLTHYGPVKIGDFSELRKEGRYYIKAGNIRSVDFAVNSNIYWDLAKMFRQACFNMRVGCKNDKHDANLLDTAYRIDTGKHIDISGGYHDAGDVRKYNRNTYVMLETSAIAAEAAINSDISPADYIDEAGWAFKHFEKLVKEFGYTGIPANIENRYIENSININGNNLRHNNYYTDNISGTEDDHVIYGGKNAVKILSSEVMLTMKSLAILGRLKTLPTDLKEKYVSHAKQIWNAISPDITKQTDMIVLGTACEAVIELYKTTNDPLWKNTAVELANKLISYQETTLLSNTKLDVTGYFYNNSNRGISTPYQACFLDQAGITALAQMCESLPEHPDALKWRMALLVCRDYYYKNLIDFSKPYGLNFFSIDEVDKTNFDYKEPGKNVILGYDSKGKRTLCASIARDSTWVNPVRGKTFMYLARGLNDLSLQEAARKSFGWLLGENQFNATGIAEIGSQDVLTSYYSIDGILPGVVCQHAIQYYRASRWGGSYKEIWIAPTQEMMQLAAMLGEKFTLSGKITGAVTYVTISSENYSQNVPLAKDGSFGPLKLPSGDVYTIKAGNAQQSVPAVAGAQKHISLNANGSISVKALYIEQEQEFINNQTKKTKKINKLPIERKISLIPNVEATLVFCISRTGRYPGKGKINFEFLNIDCLEPQLDFDLENEKDKNFRVKVIPSKPGQAWAIIGKLSNTDQFFELTGITQPVEKK